MENLKLRYTIAVILMLGVAAVVNGLQYSPSWDDETGLTDLKDIPVNIGMWKGQDFPIEEKVYEILETKAIIHRGFYKENGHGEVFLSIVHYRDTKVNFHAPEACFGGRGYKTTVTSKKIVLLNGVKEISLDVVEMITRRDIGDTLTYYFFKSGGYLGGSYINMRLSIASNKLTKNDARGSLVRISTPLISGQKEKSETRLTDFLRSMLPHIKKSL